MKRDVVCNSHRTKLSRYVGLSCLRTLFPQLRPGRQSQATDHKVSSPRPRTPRRRTERGGVGCVVFCTLGRSALPRFLALLPLAAQNERRPCHWPVKIENQNSLGKERGDVL